MGSPQKSANSCAFPTRRDELRGTFEFLSQVCTGTEYLKSRCVLTGSVRTYVHSRYRPWELPAWLGLPGQPASQPASVAGSLATNCAGLLDRGSGSEPTPFWSVKSETRNAESLVEDGPLIVINNTTRTLLEMSSFQCPLASIRRATGPMLKYVQAHAHGESGFSECSMQPSRPWPQAPTELNEWPSRTVANLDSAKGHQRKSLELGACAGAARAARAGRRWLDLHTEVMVRRSWASPSVVRQLRVAFVARNTWLDRLPARKGHNQLVGRVFTLVCTEYSVYVLQTGTSALAHQHGSGDPGVHATSRIWGKYWQGLRSRSALAPCLRCLDSFGICGVG